MASKSYTLLEYLVTLENQLKELKKYVENNSGNTGGNVDLSGIQNQINELEIEINNVKHEIGSESLPTSSQTIKGAIAETFQNVSNGKTLIASAITDKGVPTSDTDTFQQMASNIGSISSATVKDPYRENRALVWEDDFNENELNSNNWRYATGYIRNNELQYYTNNSKNIYIENSNLVIKAIKENVNGFKNGEPTVFNWTSASIETAKRKEFQYGRFEAKMKIPQTIGSFPAFWTLGNTYDYVYSDSGNLGNLGEPWAYCGEIDIMEHKMGKPYTTAGSIYDIGSGDTDIGRVDAHEIDFNEYHVYALEWTPDKIEFYVDDILISSHLISENMYMFRMPHFLILNLAIGSSGGGTPPSDVNEYVVFIDWVRVYAPQTTRITLDKTEVVLPVIDSTEQLRVNYSPVQSIERTIAWNSNNPEVATVYGGKIKAVGDGNCVVTAITNNGLTATCKVVVGAGNDIVRNGLQCYIKTTNYTNEDNPSILEDLSGNGNSFTMSGFYLNGDSGFDENGLTFNGYSSQLTSNFKPFENGLSEFTIEMYFTATKTSKSYDTYVECNDKNDGYKGILIRQNATQDSTTFTATQDSSVSLSTNIASVPTIRVIMRLKNGNLYIIKDDETEQVLNSKQITEITHSLPMTIGCSLGSDGSTISRFATMKLKTFRFYNRALTDNEIEQNKIMEE